MACNCKKKMVLEEKYGTKEEESILSKVNRYIWKCIMFVLVIVLACIVVPVLIFVIIYKMIFKPEINIVLPKFLGKYLK